VGCGGTLRGSGAEYRTHVYEYALFLVLTLIIWANLDLLRFALTRTRPGATGFLWVSVGYTAVWMASWIVREVANAMPRAREEESGEQAAGVTGQEVVQSS